MIYTQNTFHPYKPSPSHVAASKSTWWTKASWIVIGVAAAYIAWRIFAYLRSSSQRAPSSIVRMQDAATSPMRLLSETTPVKSVGANDEGRFSIIDIQGVPALHITPLQKQGLPVTPHAPSNSDSSRSSVSPITPVNFSLYDHSSSSSHFTDALSTMTPLHNLSSTTDSSTLAPLVTPKTPAHSFLSPLPSTPFTPQNDFARKTLVFASPTPEKQASTNYLDSSTDELKESTWVIISPPEDDSELAEDTFMQGFVSALEPAPLKRLDVWKIIFTEDSPIITILQKKPELEEVTIQSCSIHGSIFFKLLTTCHHVQIVRFNYFSEGLFPSMIASEASTLQQLQASVSRWSSLVHLDLSYNTFSSQALQVILEGISRSFVQKLELDSIEFISGNTDFATWYPLFFELKSLKELSLRKVTVPDEFLEDFIRRVLESSFTHLRICVNPEKMSEVVNQKLNFSQSLIYYEVNDLDYTRSSPKDTWELGLREYDSDDDGPAY